MAARAQQATDQLRPGGLADEPRGVLSTAEPPPSSPTALSSNRPTGVADPPLPLPSLLVIAALAGAIAGQGAYYRAGQWPVAILLAGAAVGAARGSRWSRADLRFPPLLICALLAAWTVVRAAFSGGVGDAVPVLVLLGGVVVVTEVARRTANVDGLAAAAVALGVLAALTGWIGVAWRMSPWALQDQGLWRGATSLTYANAAAGLLGPLALLALGRLLGRRRSLLAACSACVLLLGTMATLSRGGILATAAGAVFLGWTLGVRELVRVGLAPALGALIAFGGLLPSVPAGAPARPALAVLALLAGLSACVLLSLSHRRRGAWCVVLVGALGCVLVAGELGKAGTAVRQTRLTLASPDRGHEARAALDVVADHPLTGAGPGRVTLSWVSATGAVLVAKYAHNEYLQVFAELGLIGLGLVVALIVVVSRALRRGRRGHAVPEAAAGATAGLVVFAVASVFDFLWHVPALPLVAALLFGLTNPVTTPTAKEQHQ